MKRLTFDGNFCDIAQCREVPGGSFCEDGYCSQRKVWERLKQYEDTGLTPQDAVRFKQVAEVQDKRIDELERERDAAVADLHKMAHILRVCQFCRNGDRDSEKCKARRKESNVSCFEWRGVKE